MAASARERIVHHDAAAGESSAAIATSVAAFRGSHAIAHSAVPHAASRIIFDGAAAYPWS